MFVCQQISNDKPRSVYPSWGQDYSINRRLLVVMDAESLGKGLGAQMLLFAEGCLGRRNWRGQIRVESAILLGIVE